MATVRQKLAVKEILENHGNVSKAMRKVGYKGTTAKTPKNLTESKGFQELLEDYLPEKLLLKVHKEGLKATKRQGVGGMVLNTEEGEFGHTEIEVPDYPTRHKYLETGYKVRGRLKDNVQPGTTNNIIILADEQRARIARRAILRATGSEGAPDRLPDSDES